MPEKPQTGSLQVSAHLAAKLQAMLDHVATFDSEATTPGANFAAAEARLGELVAEMECANLGSLLAALDPRPSGWR